jgi:hypothetical protein
MPRAGFETATPETKRPQTYALDRAATGIGLKSLLYVYIFRNVFYIMLIIIITPTGSISIHITFPLHVLFI